MLLEADLTGQTPDAAITIHKALGPGLLDSLYVVCLFHELARRRLKVQRQVDLPIRYHDVMLESGSRIDLVVDDAVIVEVKAIDALAPIHDAQLLSYFNLSRNERRPSHQLQRQGSQGRHPEKSPLNHDVPPCPLCSP
jgi:GxxExxY protein